MTKVLSRKEPVRLTYQDGQVMVTPEDQDIFFISAEKATEACWEAVKMDGRIAAFKEKFLLPLHAWCAQRSERVASVLPSAAIRPHSGIHRYVFSSLRLPACRRDGCPGACIGKSRMASRSVPASACRGSLSGNLLQFRGGFGSLCPARINIGIRRSGTADS